jgi:hypothetical protein
VGTSYTYSFAVHAKTDIDWSDKLSSVADIDAVCRRIVVVFNEMWSAAMRDEGNQLRYEPFSFLFGGYTTMLLRCRAWHIVRDSEGVFSARELSLDRCRCAVKPSLMTQRQSASERANWQINCRRYTTTLRQ